MDRSRSLEELDGNARRMIDLLRDPTVDSNSPVPTCPEWTLDELANHLGRIYAWAAAVTATEASSPPAREDIVHRTPTQSSTDWLAERLDALLGVLAELPPDATRWNFIMGPDSPGAWWWRRQMHETLIHRVDAELAANRPVAAVDPTIAGDGITEYLHLTNHVLVDWKDLQLGGGLTIHLHTTDGEPQTEVTIDTENRTYALAHLKADVALRGPAWALDRWCWRRASIQGDGSMRLADAVETFGDWRAAEEWRPQR